ncbi:uncharacterized protein G2W53_043998 [Senna tora]|uniref:Uncharacterized protein n=1 Tax=Senna tora TaxID=362788 RepID=A0A834SPT8_9FABA|nr:uncharacterized protein G2W53_043998 [Senna tora]
MNPSIQRLGRRGWSERERQGKVDGIFVNSTTTSRNVQKIQMGASEPNQIASDAWMAHVERIEVEGAPLSRETWKHSIMKWEEER